MAKKKAVSTTKFKFKGFENIEFTPAERDAVIAWIDTTKFDPMDCAAVIVEAGYKLGLGYDDYSNSNVVSATCKDPGSIYWGYCFTFKHSDLGRGLQIMRYLLDSALADELYDLEHRERHYDW